MAQGKHWIKSVAYKQDDICARYIVYVCIMLWKAQDKTCRQHLLRRILANINAHVVCMALIKSEFYQENIVGNVLCEVYGREELNNKLYATPQTLYMRKNQGKFILVIFSVVPMDAVKFYNRIFHRKYE